MKAQLHPGHPQPQTHHVQMTTCRTWAHTRTHIQRWRGSLWEQGRVYRWKGSPWPSCDQPRDSSWGGKRYPEKQPCCFKTPPLPPLVSLECSLVPNSLKPPQTHLQPEPSCRPDQSSAPNTQEPARPFGHPAAGQGLLRRKTRSYWSGSVRPQRRWGI